MEELLVTGKLMRPRGLKGEIALYAYADNPERYLRLKSCFLENEEGEVLEELELVGVRIEGKKVFLKFKNYESRESVSKLSNYYISVRRSEADTLGPNEYYLADILQCEVYHDKYGYLGSVEEVILNSAQPVLRITKSGEADLYVPFIEQSKKNVDVRNKKITLAMPEGLYEIYRGS